MTHCEHSSLIVQHNSGNRLWLSRHVKTSHVRIRNDCKHFPLPHFKATTERLGILLRANQEQKDYFTFVWFSKLLHVLLSPVDKKKKKPQNNNK